MVAMDQEPAQPTSVYVHFPGRMWEARTVEHMPRAGEEFVDLGVTWHVADVVTTDDGATVVVVEDQRDGFSDTS